MAKPITFEDIVDVFPEYLAIVDRGIARLTRYHGGRGWTRLINVDIVDVEDPACCPLGQLFGSYTSGLHEVSGDAEQVPWEYGFSNPWVVADRERDQYAINYAWRVKLQALLERVHAE